MCDHPNNKVVFSSNFTKQIFETCFPKTTEVGVKSIDTRLRGFYDEGKIKNLVNLFPNPEGLKYTNSEDLVKISSVMEQGNTGLKISDYVRDFVRASQNEKRNVKQVETSLERNDNNINFELEKSLKLNSSKKSEEAMYDAEKIKSEQSAPVKCDETKLENFILAIDEKKDHLKSRIEVLENVWQEHMKLKILYESVWKEKSNLDDQITRLIAENKILHQSLKEPSSLESTIEDLLKTMEGLKEKLKDHDKIKSERDQFARELSETTKNFEVLQEDFKNITAQNEFLKLRVNELTQNLTKHQELASDISKKSIEQSNELTVKEEMVNQLIQFVNVLSSVNEQLKKKLSVSSDNKNYYQLNLNILARKYVNMQIQLKFMAISLLEKNKTIGFLQETSLKFENSIKRIQILVSVISYFRKMNTPIKKATHVINILDTILNGILSEMRDCMLSVMRIKSKQLNQNEIKAKINQESILDAEVLKNEMLGEDSFQNLSSLEERQCEDVSLKRVLASFCGKNNIDVKHLFEDMTGINDVNNETSHFSSDINADSRQSSGDFEDRINSEKFSDLGFESETESSSGKTLSENSHMTHNIQCLYDFIDRCNVPSKEKHKLSSIIYEIHLIAQNLSPDLENYLFSCRENVKELESEISVLKADLVSKNETILASQKLIQSLEEEERKNVIQIENLNVELSKLKIENKENIKLTETLKVKAHDSEVEVLASKSKLKEANSVIVDLEFNNKLYKEQIEELRSSLTSFEQKISSVKNERLKCIEFLRKEKSRYLKQLLSLQNLLKEYEKLILAAKKREKMSEKKLQIEQDSFKEKMDDLKQELKRSKTEIQNLNDKNKLQQAMLQENKRKRKTLQYLLKKNKRFYNEVSEIKIPTNSIFSSDHVISLDAKSSDTQDKYCHQSITKTRCDEVVFNEAKFASKVDSAVWQTSKNVLQLSEFFESCKLNRKKQFKALLINVDDLGFFVPIIFISSTFSNLSETTNKLNTDIPSIFSLDFTRNLPLEPGFKLLVNNDTELFNSKLSEKLTLQETILHQSSPKKKHVHNLILSSFANPPQKWLVNSLPSNFDESKSYLNFVQKRDETNPLSSNVESNSRRFESHQTKADDKNAATSSVLNPSLFTYGEKNEQMEKEDEIGNTSGKINVNCECIEKSWYDNYSSKFHLNLHDKQSNKVKNLEERLNVNSLIMYSDDELAKINATRRGRREELDSLEIITEALALPIKTSNKPAIMLETKEDSLTDRDRHLQLVKNGSSKEITQNNLKFDLRKEIFTSSNCSPSQQSFPFFLQDILSDPSKNFIFLEQQNLLERALVKSLNAIISYSNKKLQLVKENLYESEGKIIELKKDNLTPKKSKRKFGYYTGYFQSIKSKTSTVRNPSELNQTGKNGKAERCTNTECFDRSSSLDLELFQKCLSPSFDLNHVGVCSHCSFSVPDKKSSQINVRASNSSEKIEADKICKYRARNSCSEITALRSKNEKLVKQVENMKLRLLSITDCNKTPVVNIEDERKHTNPLLIKINGNKNSLTVKNIYEKNLLDLREDYEKKIMELKKLHGKDLTNLKKIQSDKINQLREINSFSIRKSEESYGIIINDLKTFYDRKMEQWKDVCANYSKEIKVLRNALIECGNAYQKDLLSLKDACVCLFYHIWQSCDSEKMIFYSSLAEKVAEHDNFLQEQIKNVALLLENDTKMMELLRSLLKQEFEKFHKLKHIFEKNVKKYKKGAQNLQNRVRTDERNPRNKLTLNEVFSFGIDPDQIVYFEELPFQKIHSSMAEIKNGLHIFADIDQSFLEETSNRKSVYHTITVKKLMENYITKGNFHDFEFGELVILYKEICSAIQCRVTRHDFSLISSSSQHDVSCAFHMKSEIQNLRMKIVELESALAKIYIEQSLSRGLVNSRLWKKSEYLEPNVLEGKNSQV